MKNLVYDFFLFELDHDRSDSRVIYKHALYLVLAELSPLQRQSIEQRHCPASDINDDEEVWEVDGERYLIDPFAWGHEQEVLGVINSRLHITDLEIGFPDKFRRILKRGRKRK